MNNSKKHGEKAEKGINDNLSYFYYLKYYLWILKSSKEEVSMREEVIIHNKKIRK